MSSRVFYSGSMAVLFRLTSILVVACGDNIKVGFSVSHSSPPTGAPTIGGTAQVGETLTANTSGISDADGLTNVTCSYQWLADETEIEGATSSTYTLQASDDGKVIKVRVTLTDDDGGDESLTSEGTAEVVTGGSQRTGLMVPVLGELDDEISWMGGNGRLVFGSGGTTMNREPERRKVPRQFSDNIGSP